MHRFRPAFSLLELMICVVIIAVLLSVLLPLMVMGRDAARTTVCASNLKQIGVAMLSYMQDTKLFPQHAQQSDWRYGGASFLWPSNRPVLANDRPLNPYLMSSTAEAESEHLAMTYRCPADHGIVTQPKSKAGTPTVGQRPLGEKSCFEYFGTSYRANPHLVNLRQGEVSVPSHRLVMVGDAEWFYGSLALTAREASFDASWHTIENGANVALYDGSVRFVRVQPGETPDYLIYPKGAPVSSGDY